MLSRFHLILERHGRTDRGSDGLMDRIAISISRVSVLTRDKKRQHAICKEITVDNKSTFCVELPCELFLQNIQ